MSLPDSLAGAGPDALPHLAAFAERRLLFQACGACGHVRHPPGPRCPRCRSDSVVWREAPPHAELYSWTDAAGAPEPGAPRFVALALYRDLSDVRFVAALDAPDADALRPGLPLALGWRIVGDAVLPVFTPAEENRR